MEQGDTQGAIRLRENKEILEDHISKALGVRGRSRKNSDPNERLRKSVSKAIENTLRNLGKKEGDELAVYLNDGFYGAFLK